MDKPARRVVAVGKAGAEQPEAPPFLVLDPVIVADRIDSARAFDRHHSSAMRSGPSARGTRCGRRRQVKRKGGSSGSSQDASTGSGGANSRTGRGGLPETQAAVRAGAGTGLEATSLTLPSPPLAGRVGNEAWTEARSGMWLSRGSSRQSAASPSLLPSRSRSGAVLAIAPVSGRGRQNRSARAATARRRRRRGSCPRCRGRDRRCRAARRRERRDGAGRGSGGRCRGRSARPGRRPGERRGRAGALPIPSRARRRTRSSASRSAARARSAGSAIGSAKLSRTRRDRRFAERRQRLRQDRRAPGRDAAPPLRQSGGRGRRAASDKDRRLASGRPGASP